MRTKDHRSGLTSYRITQISHRKSRSFLLTRLRPTYNRQLGRFDLSDQIYTCLNEFLPHSERIPESAPALPALPLTPLEQPVKQKRNKQFLAETDDTFHDSQLPALQDISGLMDHSSGNINNNQKGWADSSESECDCFYCYNDSCGRPSQTDNSSVLNLDSLRMSLFDSTVSISNPDSIDESTGRPGVLHFDRHLVYFSSKMFRRSSKYRSRRN